MLVWEKVKIENEDQFKDIANVLSYDTDYCTAEPYIETEYGIRVQKIGDSYRVYKKIHTGSGWKSQFGGSGLYEIPLTDTYKFWADECSKCYGGMDLLAVDAVHGNDGNDYILELNGTAIGIVSEHWEKDSYLIVDMVINKMNWIYCKDKIDTDDSKDITEQNWNQKRYESRYTRDLIKLVEINDTEEETSSEEEKNMYMKLEYV